MGARRGDHDHAAGIRLLHAKHMQETVERPPDSPVSASKATPVASSLGQPSSTRLFTVAPKMPKPTDIETT